MVELMVDGMVVGKVGMLVERRDFYLVEEWVEQMGIM